MNNNRRQNHLPRPGKGHNLIELAMLSLLFVVIALLCLDVGYLILGSQVNDRACRDAARAAAQADNSYTALQLAQAAVAPHKGDGYYVGSPTVDRSSFTYEDFGGNPPPNTSPYVSVTTNCSIHLPAPVLFAGSRFGNFSGLQFSKTYVFPIVKTQLYLN